MGKSSGSSASFPPAASTAHTFVLDPDSSGCKSDSGLPKVVTGMKGPWTFATYTAKEPGMLWLHADLVGPRGCLSFFSAIWTEREVWGAGEMA